MNNVSTLTWIPILLFVANAAILYVMSPRKQILLNITDKPFLIMTRLLRLYAIDFTMSFWWIHNQIESDWQQRFRVSRSGAFVLFGDRHNLCRPCTIIEQPLITVLALVINSRCLAVSQANASPSLWAASGTAVILAMRNHNAFLCRTNHLSVCSFPDIAD